MSVRRPTPGRATPPGKVAPSRRLQEVLRAGVVVAVGADADPMDVDSDEKLTAADTRRLVTRLRNGTWEDKTEVLNALDRRGDVNEMVAAGVVPVLLAFLEGPDELEEASLAVIATMALDEDAGKILVKEGVVTALVNRLPLLGDGKAKNDAILALKFLAAYLKASDVPALVKLMRNGTLSEKQVAVDLLYANHVENANIGIINGTIAAALADADAIPLLVALTRDPEMDYAKNNARDLMMRIRKSKALGAKGTLQIDAWLYGIDRGIPDCASYWTNILPKFMEVRDAMQGYGEVYEHLELIAQDRRNGGCPSPSRATLARMLLNFKILGAAATARYQPSARAAKTLFKVLTIEIDEAMTSRVWVNSRELLSKTLTLLKFAVPVVAASTVAGGAVLWASGYPSAQAVLFNYSVGVNTYNYLKEKWNELKPEEMDTPGFRAMEDTRDEYTDEALDADLKALGLDEFQIQQAQRFERWLAIAGSIAATFNAAAEGDDAEAKEAKEVMELAEAFVMRLTAPPGTDRAPPPPLRDRGAPVRRGQAQLRRDARRGAGHRGARGQRGQRGQRSRGGCRQGGGSGLFGAFGRREGGRAGQNARRGQGGARRHRAAREAAAAAHGGGDLRLARRRLGAREGGATAAARGRSAPAARRAVRSLMAR